MEKLKVLHVDTGGCEGCVVSMLRSLPLVEDRAVLKSKYLADDFSVEKCDLAVLTGPVCVNDQRTVELLKNVRESAKTVLTFGSCASLGGISRFSKGGQMPKPEHRTFQPAGSVVEVDYAIPGCPPPPVTFSSFVKAYASGEERKLQIFKALAKVKRLSGFDLLDDVVLMGLCVGCSACVISCPTGALIFIERRPELVVEKCIRCGTCYVRCPRASQILLRRYLER